jgi:hypothetical protein
MREWGFTSIAIKSRRKLGKGFMRKKWLLTFLALALAALVSAQRNWANAAEYDLHDRATHEKDPAVQIEVLLEWESANPNSEFKAERLALLINAYKNAGRPADAFARATQLFKLDPGSTTASGAIAALALSLVAPSPEQIKITEEAANLLLARAAELGRAATTVAQPLVDTAPQKANDPESERVIAFLRQWRQESQRGKHIRTAAEIESEITAVAEKALAWVKSHSQ